MVAHGVIYKLKWTKIKSQIHNFNIFPYPFSHPFLVAQWGDFEGTLNTPLLTLEFLLSQAFQIPMQENSKTVYHNASSSEINAS